MDTETILQQLVELNDQKRGQVVRTQEMLARAATRLNDCAVATGSAVLIDLPPEARQTGVQGILASKPVPFSRMYCTDLTDEELVDAGYTTIAQSLKHFPCWLDSDQCVAAAINLSRITELYHPQLLQDRSLRKAWRTISATLDNISDTRAALSESGLGHVLSTLHAFIADFLSQTSAAYAER